MAESNTRYAVVIEPHHTLAEGIAECLRQRGYVVGIAGTHAAGAAWAASRSKVDFLVASVPAAGESTDGAYLAEARTGNPAIGFIVVTSDNDERMANVPRHAVTIRKPFSALELADAIDRATTMVEPAPMAGITLALSSRETLPVGSDH
jgi:DNA-binding response OmpR family regulator